MLSAIIKKRNKNLNWIIDDSLWEEKDQEEEEEEEEEEKRTNNK